MPFSSTFCLRKAQIQTEPKVLATKTSQTLDHVVITGKTTKYCIDYYMWKGLLIVYPHLGVRGGEFACLAVIIPTAPGAGGAAAELYPGGLPTTVLRPNYLKLRHYF